MNPQDPNVPQQEPQATPVQPGPAAQQVPMQPVQPPGMGINQPINPQPQPQMVSSAHDPGHGLGIASLIVSLLGFGIVGLILGIVALNKSKKAGHSNVMAIIGIAWGAFASLIIVPIFVGLILSNFQGAQGKARDTQRITRVNAVYSKLEEYYNEKNSYPLAMDASNFPGIDPNALQDPNGIAIEVSTSAKTETEALQTEKPTNSKQYQYIAFGCDTQGCKGYVLRTYIEKPSGVYTNPYRKIGLQNP